MNAIFVKEVADTVLNGKLIKLNFNNVSNEEYIIEVNIGNKAIKCIRKELSKVESSVINSPIKLSWINVFTQKIIIKRFKKQLEKIIKINSLVGYSVVYSNQLKKNKKVKDYLKELFSKFNINEYLCSNTIKENMTKYIDEYITNNSLKNENINPIFIVKDIENLDLDLVEQLNSRYKEVTIFTGYKVNKNIKNKIKRINDECGSCIQILSRPEKDLKRYNICIFVDESRTEYNQYKFNKKACFIDFTNRENDKFNKKYVELEKGIKSNIYYNNRIKELYNLYGKITVSNCIID